MQTREFAPIQQALARSDWRQALALCQAVRTADVAQGDLLYFTGLVAQQAERGQAAISLVKQALAGRSQPIWQLSLGKLLLAEARPQEAILAFKAALELKPDLLPALFQLGKTLLDLGEPERARDCFEGILAQAPKHRQAYYHLGLTELATGQTQRAREIFTQLISAGSEAPRAHTRLGEICLQADQTQQAQGHFRAVLKSDPTNAEAHLALAEICRRQHQLRRTLQHYVQALKTRPDDLGILNQRLELLEALQVQEPRLQEQTLAAANQLSLKLQAQGREAEAFALNRRVLEIAPEHAPGHFHTGSLWLQAGAAAEAEAAYSRAIALQPDHAAAYHNRAVSRFMQGKFKTGFSDYEWRLNQGTPHRALARPRWNHRDLGGRTLLVFTEPQRGFGDTLMFARFLPLLQYYNGRVLLECQPQLSSLLRALPGIARVIGPEDPLPECDVQVPLLSLAHEFLTSENTLPAEPYLQAPADRGGPLPGGEAAGQFCKIGFVWASAPISWSPETYALYQKKSCPLEAFAPLLATPGSSWYSFQVGPHELDLHAWLAEPANHRIGARVHNLAPLIRDFADTAAWLARMDLVITVDTAVAHLAGAMGKPVWLLLHSLPYWFWQDGSQSSPWYPGMRIFRQRAAGDWQSVMEQLHASLVGLQALQPAVPVRR
ncbi:MAG: tetratricopeptide repeat protein [Candidatus Sericytochromatia bacterium]